MLFLFGFKTFTANYQGSNVLSESSSSDNSGSGSGGDLGSSGSSDEVEAQDEDAPEPTEVDGQDDDQGELGNEVEDQDENELENEDELVSQFSLNNLRQLQVKTEKNKLKIRLDSRGGKFEFENENGKLKIKAKEEDGSEFELESESIDDINEALEDEDISIASASGNKLRIRSGLFEAETHFPLSLNPTTNELTVTTPAGVKIVAVLPDQAVENLIRQKFIDIVASSSADTGIELELQDNISSFKIKGIDHQKLLGVVPVDVDKTIFVSSEDGNVLKIDQSILSRLLDLFSI